MKDIRRNPEDVVDSLNDKKKKDFNITKSSTFASAPTGAAESVIEVVKMKNETLII